MIRQFLLWITVGVVLFGTGCGACRGAETGYFAYRETKFEARIVGEMDGCAFEAEVTFDPDGVSCVRYRSPASLAGVCVFLEQNGAVRLTLNGLAYTAAEADAAGLVRPLTLLTDTPTEIKTVQKRGGLTVLSLADGTSLTLAATGLPTRVEAERIWFDASCRKTAK